MNILLISNEGSKFQITTYSCDEFFVPKTHFHQQAVAGY